MAQRKDGTPPTIEEIRRYADYLEQQIFRMNVEMADSTGRDSNADIKMLNLQFDRMVEDIRAINATLKDLTFSLSQLPVLNSKQEDNAQAILRAHQRLDKLTEDFVKHKEKFDEKLQELSVSQARGAWLERLGMAIVMAAVALWAKGGL